MKRYETPPQTPLQIRLARIPQGYPGTQETVARMQALIRQGVKDFYVRQKAIDILLEKGVRPKNYLGEIKALFEWVQQNVRYTKDPFRLEVLHSAQRMLELRAGDCDDMAILLGAMLEAIGHPVRLVIVGPSPWRPRLFTHVYLEVNHRGKWIPLDATMPHPMGWAPRTWVKKIIPIQRKINMPSRKMGLDGIDAAAPTPDWLLSLMRELPSQAIRPKDPRIKVLSDLLKQRQLLEQSRWMQAILPRIWNQGLAARPRPRTARRMVELLRRWDILPPPRKTVVQFGGIGRPFAKNVLRPVRPMQGGALAAPARVEG